MVTGRQHVQVRLVDPSVRSLNSGDCFLLVTPEHCIVWSGEFASEQEEAKVRTEHQSRYRVTALLSTARGEQREKKDESAVLSSSTFLLSQAKELASRVQSQKDLGCQASQVVYLQEGLSSDSSLAADFWNILGGRAQYRGGKVVTGQS